MKTKLFLIAVAGCLGLEAVAYGSVTLAVNPASGALVGPAASRLGWGFTLSSTVDFAVVSSSNFCLGNSGVNSLCIAPTIGAYTDYIATNYTIAGPVPESPSVTEAFNSVTGTGLGSFEINAGSVTGADNNGQIVLTYDLYSVDPNAPNFNPVTDLLSAGNFLTAPASVTVAAPVMQSIPEPRYLWIMGAVGLLGFRRRLGARG